MISNMGRGLCLLVLLALCVSTASSAANVGSGVLAHMHIGIKNWLGEGIQLRVHCKSKDDDIGEHLVGDKAEYVFDFKTNFWGTTLFHCDANYNDSANLRFDAFDFRRDLNRCEHQCLWLLTRDGLYGYNDIRNFWDFISSWPKKP